MIVVLDIIAFLVAALAMIWILDKLWHFAVVLWRRHQPYRRVGF